MKLFFIYIWFLVSHFYPIKLCAENKIIYIKNVSINDQLKKDLEKSWKIINSEKNSFIHINSSKKIISISGNAEQIKEFENLIYSIDIKPKVIKLDVIVGITTSHYEYTLGGRYFGIYNRNSTIKKSGSGFGFTGLGGQLIEFPTPTQPDDFNTNLLVNPDFRNISLSEFKTHNFVAPFTFGGPDLNTARLSPVIQFNEACGTTKVLSKPELIVSNKETAQLSISADLPLYTTVTEEKDGKVSLMYGIQYKPVGVVIKIKPIIDTERDGVTLEILLEFSEYLSGAITPDGKGGIVAPDPPSFSIFRTFQKVYIRKNESLVMSGIINREESRLLRNVPILYKIPLLGKLFQEDSQQKELQEGLIVITPSIIN